MSELVRYSKIKKKRNMHFLMKKYKDSDNTILYDVGFSDKLTNLLLSINDIKNLIIDTSTNNGINILNIAAENIYFLDSENLGGITIPCNKIIEKDRGYYFSWNKEQTSNINKINIIMNDKVKIIDVNKLKNLQIEKEDNNHISIKVEDDKILTKYIINNLKDIKIIKKSFCLTSSDIKNNIIDLSNYIDYEEIIIDKNSNIKVKELILNKKCLKSLNKLYEVIPYIQYETLKIIDDNEMKLHPDILNINHKFNNIFFGIDANNKYYILEKNYNEKLIFLDKIDNIKIIDIEKLLNNKKIEKVKFHLEDKFVIGRRLPITIIKYKNKEYDVSYYDETININRLFTEFNLYNIYKYYSCNRKEINDILINNDWYTMFEKRYIYWYDLKRIYEDYLVFLKHIKKLHDIGLSYKAIKYIYENHYDNLTNPKEFNNIDNLKYQDNYNINNMTNDEINAFNELGKQYVKKLKKQV